MIQGNENILAYLKKCDAPYWTVYQDKGDKNTHVGKMENISNLDIGKSCEELEELLNMLTPGKYLLVCKSTYDANKSFQQTPILVGEKTAAPSAAQVTGIPQAVHPGVPITATDKEGKTHVYHSEHFVHEAINKALIEHQRKIDEAKKDELIKEQAERIKELERDSFGAAAGRILTRLEPYAHHVMPHLLKTIVPTMTPISGIEEDQKQSTMANANTPQTTEQYNEKMTALLTKWEELYPGDSLKILSYIVTTAESNPEKYNMIKSLM